MQSKTVNIFNHQENLETLVKIIHPKRWKIFQVLPINGQNNGKVEKLLITSDQFQEFVARHNDPVMASLSSGIMTIFSFFKSLCLATNS